MKKNKKQRQMVRAAVLKGKDPSQIIMELEKIDNMGMYEYFWCPIYNEVLKVSLNDIVVFRQFYV